MNKTAIEWTNFTSNPVKFRDAGGKVVWGCVKVSPGCLHCYSEALAHRYQGGEFTAKRMAVMTPFLDEAELRKLLNPRALPPGSKVFIGDMTDICAPWVTDAMLDRLFATFALRPDVVFQLLTKRPGRMREYLNPTCPTSGRIWAQWMKMGRAKQIDADPTLSLSLPWPLPNVWLGTSVESQQWADMRIPELLDTPAAVRFLSIEPMLGPIDLRQWLDMSGGLVSDTAISWAICGGESGPGARPCDVGWVRDIVAQCGFAGVPVFVKQLGAMPVGEWFSQARESLMANHMAWKPIRTGKRWRLSNHKGGDMDEWPADLRVRQFPGGHA